MLKTRGARRLGAVLAICLALGMTCVIYPEQVGQFGQGLAEGRNISEALAWTIVSASVERPKSFR